MRNSGRHIRERHLDLSADDIVHGEYAALVCNVNDVHTGRRFEDLSGDMRGRTAAPRSEVELTRRDFARATSSFTERAGSDG